MKRNHSILPLRNRLSIFIDDLSPNRIKFRVKEARLKAASTPSQRQKKSLNDLSKALGFKGGFDGHQKEYPKLLEFLSDRGMTRLANLVDCVTSNFGFQITHEQLAGRLFMSGLPFPERIFTGYNFDFNRVFNGPREAFEVMSQATSYQGFDQQVEFLIKNFNSSVTDLGVPEEALRGRPWSMLEAFLCDHESEMQSPFFHLLGDILVRPYQGPVSFNQVLGIENVESGLPDNLVGNQHLWSVFKLYNRASEADHQHGNKKKNQILTELLALEFDTVEDGWVEIVPYNDDLVFLKGQNGDYDFVFREMRYNEPVFAKGFPRLNESAFLTPEGSQNFLYEYYFLEGRWRAKDMHEAYCHFYSTYDDEYPGEDNLLYRYMTEKVEEKIPAFDALQPYSFEPTTSCRFDPGEIIIREDAADYCRSVGVDPQNLVQRHISGDHGLDNGSRYTAAGREFNQWFSQTNDEDYVRLIGQENLTFPKGWDYPRSWQTNPLSFVEGRPDRPFFSGFIIEKDPSTMVSIRTDHFPHQQTSVTLKDFDVHGYLDVADDDNEDNPDLIRQKGNVEEMLRALETPAEAS